MPEDKTGDAGTSAADSGNPTEQGDALTFEALYEKLPEDQRSVFDEHTSGLKSALERLKSERNELRDAMKSLRDNRESDIESVRRELSEKLESTQKRAAFLESCPREIANPTAALAVAREFDCLKNDGSLDTEKLKKECPELFKQAAGAPPMNPGKTNGSAPPGETVNMNSWIRSRAGVA